LQAAIFFDANTHLACGPKGDDAGVGELQVRGAGEELQVFGIGTRFAGLDLVLLCQIPFQSDAERISACLR
jgi:hypothetical protein